MQLAEYSNFDARTLVNSCKSIWTGLCCCILPLLFSPSHFLHFILFTSIHHEGKFNDEPSGIAWRKTLHENVLFCIIVLADWRCDSVNCIRNKKKSHGTGYVHISIRLLVGQTQIMIPLSFLERVKIILNQKIYYL